MPISFESWGTWYVRFDTSDLVRFHGPGTFFILNTVHSKQGIQHVQEIRSVLSSDLPVRSEKTCLFFHDHAPLLFDRFLLALPLKTLQI